MNITAIYKKEVSDLRDYVTSEEHINVLVMDSEKILEGLKKSNPLKYEEMKDNRCWVSLELSYDKTTIKYSGFGTELHSAFYMAKSNLKNYLNSIEKGIESGEIEVK